MSNRIRWNGSFLNHVGFEIIDGQNDFMDTGSLPVTGAIEDAKRTAAMIDFFGGGISQIIATLDSHPHIAIFFANFWVNANGEHPTPGTQITHQMVKDRVWWPRYPEQRDKALGGMSRAEHALFYTQQLEANSPFTHTVWPDHCIQGSTGWALQEDIFRAVHDWSGANYRNPRYLVKGTNPWTEWFGALHAEVPLATDPSTQVNGNFIKALQELELLVFVGQASSHCVRTTVDQTIANFSDEEIRKIVLVKDCMSPVIIPGVIDFTAPTNDWFGEVAKKGVTIVTSDELMAMAA